MHSGENSKERLACNWQASSNLSPIVSDPLLSEILSSPGADGQFEKEHQTLLAGFVRVANACRDEECTVDPIIRSLVEVVIPHWNGFSSDQMAHLRQWVAQSMFENPDARGRLQRLWKWLKEQSTSQNDSVGQTETEAPGAIPGEPR